MGKGAKEGDDDDVENCTVQAALGDAPTAVPISANSNKENREKMVGMTDDKKPLSSNNVANGSLGEVEKVNQLFQPNILACVK